ncbi:alpha/beta hydrolase [Acholeplasma hippikon]|nr:alpha/beta hydrolase [Acholeplasma hippikon]
MKRIIKWTVISIASLFLLLIVGLTIYASNAYKPLDEMYEAIEQLDTSSITVKETFDSYQLTVNHPKGQIVIIPGGLVYTESYLFLAYNLSLKGYNVTVAKALFHLSILTPNYTKKFLSNTLPNIIIGHSLGGTVAGMIAHDNTKVDHLILLASYTTTQIKHASVLLITAENDLVLNKSAYDNSLSNYETYTEIKIEGGNHAGFGWYGNQKGDGIGTITTKNQQQQVIDLITEYLE